jgi:hypothetical protein
MIVSVTPNDLTVRDGVRSSQIFLALERSGTTKGGRSVPAALDESHDHARSRKSRRSAISGVLTGSSPRGT